MLEITTKMEQAINKKENLTKKLNDLCDQLVALEIKEATKRVAMMNKLDAEAIESGKKMTDKSKTALCDVELKNEMNKIKHLKNNISKVKRDIDLCNDKISLQRNVIREMELSHL